MNSPDSAEGIADSCEEESGPEGLQAATQPEDSPATIERQISDMHDRLLRTQAELDNFRKRSRREYEEALRYTGYCVAGN